jgi:hypothetical protein
MHAGGGDLHHLALQREAGPGVDAGDGEVGLQATGAPDSTPIRLGRKPLLVMTVSMKPRLPSGALSAV